MIEMLKKIFTGETTYDHLIEGVYAHQYKDGAVRERILADYEKRYRPVPDPLSHPERFDPLNPPKGWIYDPYYEIWIRTNES
jgi:hypothetical protein